MVRFFGCEGTRIIHSIPPEHQPPAELVQNPAVLNTWYTLLNTTNVIVYWIAFHIDVAESIEVRMTIDGDIPPAILRAAALGTEYEINHDPRSTAAFSEFITSTRASDRARSYLFAARNLHIEIRKTTNNNPAAILYAKCQHGRWP